MVKISHLPTDLFFLPLVHFVLGKTGNILHLISPPPYTNTLTPASPSKSQCKIKTTILNFQSLLRGWTAVEPARINKPYKHKCGLSRVPRQWAISQASWEKTEVNTRLAANISTNNILGGEGRSVKGHGKEDMYFEFPGWMQNEENEALILASNAFDFFAFFLFFSFLNGWEKSSNWQGK